MGSGEAREEITIICRARPPQCCLLQLFCCWTFYKGLVNVFINCWNISPGQDLPPLPPPVLNSPALIWKAVSVWREANKVRLAGGLTPFIGGTYLSGNISALSSTAICSPSPPILLLSPADWGSEMTAELLSCLPCEICRETDKNTIKSSRYVYAFSFPRYNRFRRITCKNFCTVLQSYVTLQFPILVNNHQHYSLQ